MRVPSRPLILKNNTYCHRDDQYGLLPLTYGDLTLEEMYRANIGNVERDEIRNLQVRTFSKYHSLLYEYWTFMNLIGENPKEEIKIKTRKSLVDGFL